jgi:hypothetical protein
LYILYVATSSNWENLDDDLLDLIVPEHVGVLCRGREIGESKVEPCNLLTTCMSGISRAIIILIIGIGGPYIENLGSPGVEYSSSLLGVLGSTVLLLVLPASCILPAVALACHGEIVLPTIYQGFI